MSDDSTIRTDAGLDLGIERTMPVPRARLWAGWTQPELLKQWFTPEPWRTVDCEIDLRPGGIFRTVMRGPEGQEFANAGCYLEVVENARLVWTGALGPGFRPLPAADIARHPFLMTAVIALADAGAGTGYSARVLHGDAAARDRHLQMNFHDGWAKALDQLVDLVRPR